MWCDVVQCYACMRVRMYVRTYGSMQVCIYVYIYIYICTYTCTCMCTCTYECIHIHTHIHIHVSLYIYIYVHVRMSGGGEGSWAALHEMASRSLSPGGGGPGVPAVPRPSGPETAFSVRLHT